MPKNKYLTTPVKEAIVRAKSQGQTCRAVANLFNVSRQTVSRVFRQQEEEGFQKFKIFLLVSNF